MPDQTPIQQYSKGDTSTKQHFGPDLTPEGEVISLIADVERKLVSMRAAQSRQVEHFADLENREKAVEELEKALAKREKALAEVESSTGETRFEVRERVEELERLLMESEAARAELETEREQVVHFAEKLRIRAEHVSVLATGLEQRRRRLQGFRLALNKRKQEGWDSICDNQREESESISSFSDLERARACLAASEQQMMRKWGRHWAFAGVAWFTLLVFMVGVGSWFVVDRFMVLPGVATVDMVASTPSGRPLKESSLEGWSTWHRSLPSDPAFAELIHKRLSMRGLIPAGGKPAVTNLLADDLGFDSDGPGRLRLILSGEDRRNLVGTLDVIATTLVGESSRQAPRREQSVRASIVGERNALGRTMHASLVPMSLDTAFFTRYALVVGIALGLALGMVWLIYGALRRGKQVFEESDNGSEFGELL